MDDVSLAVDQYIPIVAILHLKKIRKYRVPCKTPHEIFASEVGQGKRASEELPEREVLGPDFFEETIESGNIIEHLNDPAIWPKRDHLVRKHHTL